MWLEAILEMILLVIFLVAVWNAASFANELLSPLDSCSVESSQVALPTPYTNSDGQLVYLDPRLNELVEVGQTMVPVREACGENTKCIRLIASACDGSVHPINGQFYLMSIVTGR